MVAINEIFRTACDGENRGDRGGLCVKTRGVKTRGRLTRDPIGVPDLTQAKSMISGQASGGISLYGYVEFEIDYELWGQGLVWHWINEVNSHASDPPTYMLNINGKSLKPIPGYAMP